MKLLDQYEAACKVRRLARRTIQTYRRWVEEFLRFHHCRAGAWIHPNDMGGPEVEGFLTHLAVNRRVAERTQNQALGAILFPYRHVLNKDLGRLDAVRASRPKRLPTVLSKEEVRRVFAAMPEKAAHRLIVELLYGTGMRISECCQLRVCDIDFDRGRIVIRGGKGNKERMTMLPQSLEARLKAQVEFVRLRHEHDVEHGAGDAPVPTSAATDDAVAARQVFEQLTQKFHPCLQVVWADSKYHNHGLHAWLARHAKTIPWTLEIVRRPQNAVGFVLLPKRWTAECTFAWLGRNRRLRKDYEVRTDSSECKIRLASIHQMLRRLAPQNTDPAFRYRLTA